MFPRVFLAVSLVISAGPSMAGGSMSREVSIIYVKPPLSVIRQNQAKADAKARVKLYKETEKSNLEAQKFAQKRALEADKAYYKKLDQQRKARRK